MARRPRAPVPLRSGGVGLRSGFGGGGPRGSAPRAPESALKTRGSTPNPLTILALNLPVIPHFSSHTRATFEPTTTIATLPRAGAALAPRVLRADIAPQNLDCLLCRQPRLLLRIDDRAEYAGEVPTKQGQSGRGYAAPA